MQKKDQVKFPLNKHNKSMLKCATDYAESMHNNPSFLEKKMISFLNQHGIPFRFQWILLMFSKDMQIERFYIADFFIPEANLLIEVNGKFHRQQEIQDERRINDILGQYPGLAFFILENEDFSSEKSMEHLLSVIQQRREAS